MTERTTLAFGSIIDPATNIPAARETGSSFCGVLSSMELDALVVREGDRVTAWGRLVRNEQGDWFEPPLPVALPPFPAPRGIRVPWQGAVRVLGANFDGLKDRYERDGAVEGWATLMGIWSGNQLRAEHQTPAGHPPVHLPAWDTPPCPPPEGGWPYGMNGRYADNLDYDLGDLKDTGAAVTVTTFRPGQNQAVLVVAAADPNAVEAQLRPQLGARLCVVRSRWTRREFDAVRAHLHGHRDQWNLYQWGESSTEDGQACITASLTRVLPEIATWAASLAPGILALDPWLTTVAA